jgi:hypothetical protein
VVPARLDTGHLDFMNNLDTMMQQVNVNLSVVVKYEALKADLTSLDIVSGPMYMRDFNVAYEEVSKLAIQVQHLLEGAIEEMDHQEALAKFERAPEYFKTKEILSGTIKDSGQLRDAYVSMDHQYRAAKERVAMLRALVKYLDVKAESFKMAHDDAKKIYGALTAGPFGKSGYEGMSSG